MATKPSIWIDGVPASSLSLPSRGFDYGDGVFETMLANPEHLYYLDAHLDRLARGLEVLAIPDCIARVRQYLSDVRTYLAEQAWPWASLRVTVSRGSGPRGYAPVVDASPTIVIALSPLDRDCATMMSPASLMWGSLRLAMQPALAGIKHLNRLEQVLAAAECQSAGADEIVLLDIAGSVNSLSAGNIFIVKDNEILTPPIVDCGIAGTRRRMLLEHWAPSAGLAVREAQVQAEDLSQAEEAFYTNSLVGVRSIASIDTLVFKGRRVAQTLFTHCMAQQQ